MFRIEEKSDGELRGSRTAQTSLCVRQSLQFLFRCTERLPFANRISLSLRFLCSFAVENITLSPFAPIRAIRG
jgi:hypothetical protein